MAVHRHAVIGSKQNDGVFRLAGFLERVEHAADVVVEVRDQAVVRGVLLLGAIDRRRIAAAPTTTATTATAAPTAGALPLVGQVRAKRGVVRRERDFFRVVHRRPLAGRRHRRVRCGERDVAEKRLLRFRLPLDEVNRRSGEHVGGEGFAGIVRHHQPGDHLVNRHVDMRPGRAAEEHRLGLIETVLERQLAVVPLAGGERFVASFLEHLRHQHPGVEPQRRTEQRLAAHEHRPARQTGGAGHRALDVRLVKNEAAVDDAIHVGRLDVRVAQRAEGVRPLVVGEDEKNVRPLGRRRA